MKKLSSFALFVLISFGLSSQASASLILESYDSGEPTPMSVDLNPDTSYLMTSFDVIGTAGPAGSAAAPGGGTVDFYDISNSPIDLNRSTADSLTDDIDWWVNGEGSDYNIYTTDVNYVTLMMPENTLAFSFNVGADLGSTRLNAWLSATETDGSGIDQTWFNVNRDNTPGFGIYVDRSDHSCSYITSVTIEPDYWGFGNFSIDRGDCSSKVPEPSIAALFAVGLFGLGLALRTKV